MMGYLTTHVLDTAGGCPGAGIQITLYRITAGGALVQLCSAVTNADGRIDGPILKAEDFGPGTYQLDFAAGDYFRARGVKLGDPAFLDVVPVRFGIADADAHYHVPLLISPYGYSTYRGS
jgi:5-hydroxyisourate hydrolase